MLSELLEIPLTKGCILAIYDTELMDALPEDMLARGLKRGKAIRRCRLQRERERKLAHNS